MKRMELKFNRLIKYYKIKIYLYTRLLVLLFVNINLMNVYANNNQHLIGGFSAPIYFTTYDLSTINKIIELSNTPNIKGVKIIYPTELKKNAQKIIQQFTELSQQKFIVKSTSVKLVDTDSVHYRHDIVVFLYFRDMD